MQEYLTPARHNAQGYMHDPYTASGARSILRRFRDDVINMLDEMDANRQLFDHGKTMLAKSPLRSKPYVAAAMKTLGLVDEQPTATGACGLVLTEKAISQIDDLKKYL